MGALLASRPQEWVSIREAARLLRTKRAHIKGIVWAASEWAAWPRGYESSVAWVGGATSTSHAWARTWPSSLRAWPAGASGRTAAWATQALSPIPET